jgi:NADPH-dependent curcumin reductase CurA
MNVMVQSLMIQGFIVFRLEEQHPHLLQEFYEKVLPLIANGEIKYKEDVTHGLDQVGDVILSVQKGLHKGKAVVFVAED